jgi:hypothetical protein
MRRDHIAIPIFTRMAAAALLFAGTIAPLYAETIASTYTSTAPSKCRVFNAGDGADGFTIRVCPGKDGLLVLVSEDDLRETISVGRTPAAAAEEPAAKFWFAPFNSTRTRIEWRTQDGKPFAIIQRWLIADIDDQDKRGRPKTKPLLVVTRLPPGAVCHVAYIDAKANPEAKRLARKAADEFARNFDCEKDEVKVFGASGRAIDLARKR